MNCKCGKAAIYLRRNEGRHYCSTCLSRQIERNFQKTSRGMISPGDRIAIGVSGGKDSMVLLHLMKKLSKKVPIELVVITVDEGIPGHRDKGIKLIKEFAAANGIEHIVKTFGQDGVDMKGLKDIKNCTYCGVFRRRILNKTAREAGATKLAVGHNLDDEAQSIMMNVIRGDAARMNRSSKSGKFVNRIKPVGNIPKKELAAYAIINRIPFSDEKCPRAFDNTRKDVQTMLNGLENKYPGTKNQIASFYRKIKGSIPEKEGNVGQCSNCGEPTSQEECKACQLKERIVQK